MKRTIGIWLALLFLPYLAFSTHIVGGVLNYVYNGNNVYTLKLKLYRDCGSNSAAFPSSITIYVRGNNGATFSPSKDLTINLGTVTTLSANLAPCAQPPNPMPCVQEGVYTKTISLPANTGGYHLYYQVSARNLSLTNINGACNCIGESFYAYIPDNTISSNTNNNAVFNAFPPLFLCVNEPFSFNHAATDADGDSLVYSLYTPYDGDNGSGPLDPTFSNNTASFTPVTFLSGYSVNNPLGASPFTLNPLTGVLTGTPGTIGQFVVGVKVKEYRNGVFISQTLRDFQFNVLNCPAPPPTLAISNFTMDNNCSIKLNAAGVTPTTITWTSIAPGSQGAYNSFLSCTVGCTQPSVVATGTPPPYIDFKVCGIASNCLANFICDTFRVYFNPTLSVTINPANPSLCNGQTSTTISAVPAGGTSPYTYLWNNVNPTQTISVGAGTYNIKLTDATGCPPVYNSVVVNTYSVPVSANAGADQNKCNANPIATINATITGATGGVWSGGTGTFSPNNTTTSNLFYTPSSSELAVGSATLFLTTTGNGNCPADIDTVVIRYTGFTGSVSASVTPVSCYNGSNGSVSLSVVGGGGAYTWLWSTSPTKTTSTAANLIAGIYSVTATNSVGCTSQITVSVTQPSPVAISSTVTNVSCYGGSNGDIFITATGGTAPYTYSWQPVSATTSSVSGLAAGTYTSRVTDSKSCTLSTVFSITQPSSLTVSFSQTNVACFNGNGGSVSATVNGGTSPYTYSWSPGGATSSNVGSLPAGVYSLTAKDNFNCAITKTVNITQPPAITVTTTVTNETCNYLNNGSVTASPGGGTPGYIYLWQPGAFTTSTANGLASGNYSLTLSDSKGCSTSTVVTVTEPTALSISFINLSNVSCFGGNNGSVTANVSGGTPNYTYSWSTGSSSTNSLTGLGIGVYSLTVTDSKTCTTTNTLTVTQPASLTASAIITTVSCFGGNDGALNLTPTGGTSPYNYFWLPGGQTTSSINSLSAGAYTATVTDAKGCLLNTVYTVIGSSSLSVSFAQTNVSCFNGNNGTLNASVTGGSSPYNFTWSPGSSTSQTISSLSAGVYTVQVFDVKNCNTTKTVSITQPSSVNVVATATNETCDYLNNGSASAQSSGGTPGYSYLWQPGALTSTTVSNLSSGIYTVIATDLNGCAASTTVSITEPSPLSVAATTIISVSCFGGNNGSASVSGAGGTPNYSYTWSPGGTTGATKNNLAQGVYTVSVSDNKTCTSQTIITITQPASITLSGTITNVSCNGGNNGSIGFTTVGGTSPYTYFWLPFGQTTSIINNLTAGNYSVTATDSKGCVSTANYSVSQSASISISFTSAQVSCFNGNNGSIQSGVSGGNSPYSFNWLPGNITTQNISGVQAGTYTLTVTDNFNCTASKTVTVTQPTQLTINTTVVNETCDYLNNGSASALAAGGTAGYTYTWQPGSISLSAISGLSSGVYTVSATDAWGCTTSSTAVVSEPLPVGVSFTNILNVSCHGGSDGSATSVGFGGTPNYSYTWTPGGSNASMANNLAIGVYSVFVSDAHGCVSQNTVSISEPAALNLVPSISNVVCNGGSNGAISISMSGGTAPYSHILMPGNISGVNFTNLQPGTYSIITTDANGCINTTSLTINQPINISTSTSFTNSDCNTLNGVATISVTSGGTPPFTYSWMPSGGTGSLSAGLGAGSYTVQVTDSIGCVSTKIVNINDINAPVVSIVSTTNVTCYGGSNGALTATYSGGTGSCTYSWTPSGGSALNAPNLTSGIYVIQVTDNAGCIGFATSTLVAEPPPMVVNVYPTQVSCFGGGNGGGSSTISGGTPGYTCTWLPGASTGTTVSGLISGSYTLQVNDANNCFQTSTFAISQPSAPLNVSVSSVSVSCNSGSNGSAFSTATGGTAPYNYNLLPGNFAGQSISNLVAGIYTVSVTDVKSCSATGTVAVTQPLPITLTTSAVNSNCSLANGQASVNASGGTGTYTFNWLPSGGTNFNASGLMAGAYTVIATDANNCQTSGSLTIIDNPSPLVSINTVTNVSCFGGSDGVAVSAVAGGTGPFTYTWIPSGGNAATATGLSSGSYSVNVLSANGCTVMAVSPVITQPTQVFVSVSTISVSCFGGNNGGASAIVNGGTPGYSYTWQASASVSSNVSGLPSGIYSVQVGDANTCIQTTTFAISQPTAPLTLSLSSNSVSCFGGSNGAVISSASGGTSPYNFSTGSFNGQTISNLSSGVHTIVATDFNGCSTTGTVLVTQPQPITLTTTPVNSNCSFANGQISVTASGGTGNYSYQWWPVSNTNSLAIGLLAGPYTVTVMDVNSCTSVATTTVMDNPAPTVSVSSVTNVSCYGGSNGAASANVTGGSGPFTYSWLPAGGGAIMGTGLSSQTYTVWVNAANGCSVMAITPFITQPSQLRMNIIASSVTCFGGTGSASITTAGGTPGYTLTLAGGPIISSPLSGLSAGNYSIELYDANNCLRTSTFSIAQPTAPLSVLVNTISNVSCFGGNNGSATVIGSGGTPVYSYNWSPYGGTANSAGGFSAGTYSTIVIDNNGCTTLTTVTIGQPSQPLSGIATITSVSCFGGTNGSASAIVSGGTSGYSYQWSPSGGTLQTANGLSQGNYTLSVTDINSCQLDIPMQINQPSIITGSLLSINASCGLSNGFISSQLSGGTGPYACLWSPGSFTAATINSLAPGSYTLQVTDAANCISTFSTTLINIPGPSLAVSSVGNVSCFGGNNGTATLNISQGTAPFNITWLPFGGSGLIGNSFVAGTYAASVTDALGCIVTTTAVITEPSPISVSILTITNVSCKGGDNGSISVIASGGTPNYTYAWSPSHNGNSIANLIAGDYNLTVTDSHNCQQSISAIVVEPTILSASITGVTNAPCYGSAGSASVSASGGSTPYTYSWNTSPAQTANVLSDAASGNYTVITTDVNGCAIQNTVTISQPAQVKTFVTKNDTVCFGKSGFLTASATGGSGNYYYSWQPSNSVNSGTLQFIGSGSVTYTVLAFDKDGCSGMDAASEVTVYNLKPSNLHVSGLTPVCPGQNSMVEAEVSGNTGPLTFSWNNGLGNKPGSFVVTPSQATTYIITVTNSCGSSISDSIKVLISELPVVKMASDTIYACAPGEIHFSDKAGQLNAADPIISWNWDFGDGNFSGEQHPGHSFSDAGLYSVSLNVISDRGCSNKSNLPINIRVYPKPVANFRVNKDSLDLPYDVLLCTNQSTGAVNYNWTFGNDGNSTLQNPQILLQTLGNCRIELMVTSEYGCSDTIVKNVTTNADIVFPNAFTPREDASSGGNYTVSSLDNDVFFPYTSGVIEYRLMIFNRWGEMIFESDDVKLGWDGYYRGKLCQGGVYVWKAKIKLSDGKVFNKAGNVTLLR